MAAEALTSALPRITPLVLERRAEAFDNDGWLFELKYDGFRALLEIDGAGARLVSRNRNRFKHLDTLAAVLAKRLRAHRCHPRREQRPTALDRTAAAFDEPRGLSGCVLGTL